MNNIVIEEAKKDFNPNIVSIDEAQLAQFKFNKNYIHFFFDKKEHIDIRDIDENISFILGFNSICYQYWDLNESSRLERYQNQGKIAGEAVYEGFQNLYSKISNGTVHLDLLQDPELFIIFGNIPDRKGRLECIKESLNKHKLAKVIKVIHDDAANSLIDTNTAKKIAEIMPKSFSDPYLKKVQLALYEITELLLVKYPRLKVDLTVPVESQLPKVLSASNILVYSESLRKAIDSAKPILADSPEEKAIRAATVLACDKLCKLHEVSAHCLYKALWDSRKNYGAIKFHLTKTRRY